MPGELATAGVLGCHSIHARERPFKEGEQLAKGRESEETFIHSRLSVVARARTVPHTRNTSVNRTGRNNPGLLKFLNNKLMLCKKTKQGRKQRVLGRSCHFKLGDQRPFWEENTWAKT